MSDEKKRFKIIALIAVILALMGFVYASIPQDIAFEIVKNNTDMCRFNHTSVLCDGERQSNVTYYTNNTPIVLYVFAHASASGGVAGVFLYRDDVLIEAQSGRPLAAPEQTWRGITAIIPKNSSYRVNFTNYHHFEWYEDQILSGRNGTLSINQTGGGCTGDCAFNNLTVNSLGKNDTTDGFFSHINLISPFRNTIGARSSAISLENADFEFDASDTNFSATLQGNSASHDIRMTIQNGFVRTYVFNDTYLDLNSASLINCANCANQTDLLGKVNKTGDTTTGTIIYNTDGANITRDAAKYDASTWGYLGVKINNNSIMGEQVMSSTPAFASYFGAAKACWNSTTSTMCALRSGEVIFNFYGIGYDGSSWVSSQANIEIKAGTNAWNSTSHPTEINIYTQSSGDVKSVRLKIDQNGNITMSKYATGSKVYACFEADGTLSAGTPGC